MNEDQNSGYRLQLDRYLADLEAKKYVQQHSFFYHGRNVELLKASFEFAYIAIKSLLLLNGAAAISTLTFIGNADHAGSLDKQLFLPLILFGIGALTGAFSAGMAYLAQLLFFHVADAHTLHALEQGDPPGRKGKAMRIGAEVFRALGIASAFAGYSLFIAGLLRAAAPYL